MAEIWQHVTTGGFYEMITSGRLGKDGEDGAKYVVYRSMQPDGRTWIRPAAEFFDGRFKLMKDSDQ